MSYLVLARKYRPRVFADMVGQEVVTATLAGAIREDRVGHAYLFTGPRGTGKTTTARILAKALNCEKGPTPDPCGVCERCRAAESGSEIDLVEIDAASNTGVDYVRELREQAAYLPMHARYKIYIVDEVHMLSKPAFNALLKTLEEPPPHVKFLFATTELEKVIETVVSRCQVLRLVPLQEETIVKRLDWVFEQEGVRAEPGVTAALARRARGGMRDALSLADQLLSLGGETPKLDDIGKLSAAAGGEAFEALFSALETGDPARALAALPGTEGSEAEFLSGALDHLRATLLVGLCGEGVPVVDLSPSERKLASARAERLGVERLSIWLEELLLARERMRELPQHSRLSFELALFDLCRPESALALDEIASRLEALESRMGQSETAPRAAELRPAAPAVRPAPAAPPVPARAAVPAPAPAPALDAAALWKRFLEELEQHSSTLAETLRARGRLGDFSGARVGVRISGLAEPERVLFQTPRNARACAQILSRLLGREVTFALEEPAAPQRKPQDSFTGRVTELFGGRMEDEG
ncbi:MAG: DNA polymerase III subunit gamma/tau [Planctomycetes bacterium]|nr:DNA polymerase III subunit gamma/tau [Planctomycetota bacterium]